MTDALTHLDRLTGQLQLSDAQRRDLSAAREQLRGAPRTVLIRLTPGAALVELTREDAARPAAVQAAYGLTEGGFQPLSGDQVRAYAADLPCAVTVTEVQPGQFELRSAQATALVTPTDAEATQLRGHGAGPLAHALLWPRHAARPTQA